MMEGKTRPQYVETFHWTRIREFVKAGNAEMALAEMEILYPGVPRWQLEGQVSRLIQGARKDAA